MVTRIIDLIFAISIALPLLVSLLYLLKIVKDSKQKDTSKKFAAKLLASFVFTLIAIFLLYYIFFTFVFVEIGVPKGLMLLGVFLFMLYYCTFGGFLYGLGMLGSASVSPNKIIRELYEDLFKKTNKVM